MSKFNNNQINMATNVASYASIYQENHLDNAKPPKNDRDSLLHFLLHYAYERQGAPRAYPRIAERVIMNHFQKNIGKIEKKQVEQIWQNYCDLAKNNFQIKPNEKANPMNVNKGLLTRLYEKDTTNIYRYISDLIKNDVKEAYTFIRSIRGIDTKIGSFYLRDVAYWEKLPREIENHYALQPLDTWVKQSINIIGKSSVPSGIMRQKKWIIKLCNQADISGIEFNQGAWVAGSLIAGDYSAYTKIIKNKSSSKEAIKIMIKENEKQNRILQKWLENNT